jgi:hypothetical protein
MGIEVLRDGESAIVIDDDHLNVLIVTWFGAATVKNVERFQQWSKAHIAKATAARRYLVMINDALDAERPAPEARAALARQSLETDIVVASPVVITNALVRGAMTAIGWMMGDRMKGVTAHATLDEAFELACKALAERGVRIDKDAFANYRRPVASKIRAAGS